MTLCICTIQTLDRLASEGCEVFGRPCRTLAASQPLQEDIHIAHTTPESRQESATAAATRSSRSNNEPDRGASAPGNGDVMPLWRSILDLDLLPQCRAGLLVEQVRRLDAAAAAQTTDANTQDGDKTDADSPYFMVARAVLVEAALAAGLGHLVAAYVLQPSTALTAQSGYLLADVRRFHESLVGSDAHTPHATSAALVSLQTSLESALHLVCHDRIVRALLSESEIPAPSGLRTELKELQDLAAGLQQVTEALLTRKLQALADHSPVSRDGAMDEPSYEVDDVLQSVIAEGQQALQVQLAELRCLQRVLSVLNEVAQTPGLSFRALFTAGLHQRTQTGRVHSSTSSSAAAGSVMLSEYHYARHTRTEMAGAQCDQLPDRLHTTAEGLLGVLCSLLHPQCQTAVRFLLHPGGHAVGVNLNSLAETVTSVLLLPLTALRAAVADQRAHNAHSRPPSAQDGKTAEAILSSASTVAFSVVAYFLADMQHLSLQAMQDAPNHHMAVAETIQRVCSAAQVPHTVANGVLALWQVDSGTQVAQAVATLCRVQDCTVTQDETILYAVIRNLLCAGHLYECQVRLALPLPLRGLQCAAGGFTGRC
jgi:hypothetical protein